MDLQELKNNLAKEAFGLTKEEAITKGICLYCKEQAMWKCSTRAGRREYLTSGICEECFDDITKEPA